MIMEGQQTYGHHMTSGVWIPPHAVAMDHGGTPQAHTHNMYTMSYQPVPQMYYEMDTASVQAHSDSSHHQLGDLHQHQPVTRQTQQQPTQQQPTQQQLAQQEQELPANQQQQQTMQVSTETDSYPSKQFSPSDAASQNSPDPNDPPGAFKAHSTPMTLKWLNDNYEAAEGVCIPRSTLYQHYIDFCETRELNPVNAASFGKIIRQQFPQITTRRLGTRGQSKYHYYGIGVREQSPYYDFVYSKAGLQNANTVKKETPKQPPIQAYSPRSKMGTLLPEFPDVDELKLPNDIEPEKLLTFIMMYRTHCQRILDTVIRANFDEVQNFLLHFWQGMPGHMTAILGAGPIVGMVAVCDTILYKAICNVLMPHVLQPLPESLTVVIKKFAKQLEDWISVALNDLPDSLKEMKLSMARKFSRILRLQMSLNHLCQASRSVVSSADIMSQMLDDWQAIDRKTIIKQTQLTLCQNDMVIELSRINHFYDEFEVLLQDQVSMESYVEWLDKIIDESIVKVNDNKTGSVKKKSQSFLLVWSAFSTKIIRDMTLHSAPSFGSFHLLHLMFDDYILYHLEHMCCSEMSDEILSDIKGTPKVSSIGRDVVLPSRNLADVTTGGMATANNIADAAQRSQLVPSAESTEVPIVIQQSQNEFITSSHVELLSHLTHSVDPTSSAHTSTKLGQSASAEASTATTRPTADVDTVIAATATSASSSTPVSRHSMVVQTTNVGGTSSVPVSSQQHNSMTYYMSELDNVEQTWRLQDSTPAIQTYHGENFTMPVDQSNTDILYYAVNGMNLAPESVGLMTNCDSASSSQVSSRVMYDPVEAQEALNRSFQPYTHHLFDRETKASGNKRAAREHDSIHANKRFHEDSGGQTYETTTTDGYVLS